MSLETWHNYGYGINTRKITTTEEKLKAFITSLPSVKAEILEWEKEYLLLNDEAKLEAYGYDDAAEDEFNGDSARNLCELYEEYGEFDDIDGFSGLVLMLLSEHTDLPLVGCRDCNTNDCYVIIPPRYPWEASDTYAKIKSLEELRNIFEKSIIMLTGQTLDELDWGEHTVESFG